MIYMIISYLLVIILCLLSVAFLTLLERKVLGYIQIRKGPNKVGIMGIMQPFSDALKLFSKEMILPQLSNMILYFISPMFILSVSMYLWFYIPMFNGMFYSIESILMILSIMGFMSYPIIVSGWSSNSMYSLLGSIRGIAQIISYEVSLLFIIFSLIFIILGFSLYMFMEIQFKIWNLFLGLLLFIGLLISMLAETNRSPFDFSEGESELVSGFNIEYGSWGFSFIFLGEYMMIIFSSFIISCMFMGGNLYSMLFFFKVLFIIMFWLWVRGSFPRFRYDKLMYLAWKKFLPIYMGILMYYFMLSYWMFIYLI